MHKFFCFSLFINIGWVVWEDSGWVTQESDFVIPAEHQLLLSTIEMNLRGGEESEIDLRHWHNQCDLLCENVRFVGLSLETFNQQKET